MAGGLLGMSRATAGHARSLRPSNRLWPTLHLAGFTPRRLHPSETDALREAGIGITNLVPRATARADELSDEEVRAGRARFAVADARLWVLPDPSGLDAHDEQAA
ncbi:MAG: hypothetical protein ACRDTP_12070 [Mycobacteriales bacterium]